MPSLAFYIAVLSVCAILYDKTCRNLRLNWCLPPDPPICVIGNVSDSVKFRGVVNNTVILHTHIHDAAMNTGAGPLETFLRELFNDIHYERITHSKRDVGNCTFHDVFKDV